VVALAHFPPSGKEEQGETTQTGEEGCGGFRNYGRGALGALGFDRFGTGIRGWGTALRGRFSKCAHGSPEEGTDE